MDLKPHLGLMRAHHATEEFKSEWTEMEFHLEYCTGPGLLEWARSPRGEVDELKLTDAEGQEVKLQAVAEEMELRDSSFTYLPEHLECQRQVDVQEKRGQDLQIQHEMNRRLSVSLAPVRQQLWVQCLQDVLWRPSLYVRICCVFVLTRDAHVG